MLRLQLPPCPADALKARQTEGSVLCHDLRKGYRPRILQAEIAKGKLQYHVIVSGIFILLQNGL